MLRSTTARVLIATGAVAAAGLLTATAAFAHGAPFTITAGSAQAGTSVAFTASSIPDPVAPSVEHVTFQDTTTSFKVTCDSAKFTGSMATGSSTGTPFASGSSFVVSDCSNTGGLVFDIIGSGTILLNAGESADGVTTGTITNFRAHVVNRVAQCSFDIGANTGSFASSETSTVNPGTLPLRYTNSTQQLALPPTKAGSLGLWNVKRAGTGNYCISPLILKQGDQVSMSVTFKVAADVAANNPIAVN